jgi:hypothetical protein
MNNIHSTAVWNISRANSPMLFQEIIGWWSMNLLHASRATSDRLAYSVRTGNIPIFIKGKSKKSIAEKSIRFIIHGGGRKSEKKNWFIRDIDLITYCQFIGDKTTRTIDVERWRKSHL